MFETTAPGLFTLEDYPSDKGLKNDAMSVQHRESGNQFYQKNKFKVKLSQFQTVSTFTKNVHLTGGHYRI